MTTIANTLAPITPMAPHRKVVQIVVSPETESYHPQLYALCDDGTIFVRLTAFEDNDLTAFEDNEWLQIPCIPQPQ